MVKVKKITYLLREALSTIMKHTKLPRFLTFGGVVLAISLVIVLGLSNKIPLKDYFEENPDELSRIVFMSMAGITDFYMDGTDALMPTEKL
jgi:hypothetical protein